MDKIDCKKLLWANVQTLMRDRSKPTLGQVARDAGMVPANMTRVAAAKTDVGIELLQKLAKVFEVEPWQLIAPDLGAHLHTIKDKQLIPAYAAPHPKSSAMRLVSGESKAFNVEGAHGGDHEVKQSRKVKNERDKTR